MMRRSRSAFRIERISDYLSIVNLKIVQDPLDPKSEIPSYAYIRCIFVTVATRLIATM